MLVFTFVKQYAFLFICSLLILIPKAAWSGGIALGATRVIYPYDAKQVSLAVTNSDDKTRYLVQSWIENVEGKKDPDFFITPPLFVSKPKSENTLRIIYGGSQLPKDRETLFWLNSKSIPAVDKNDIKGKNVLQIAVLARIKLFIRPDDLPMPSEEAPSLLTFNIKNGNLFINNPSPYYVTLINIKLGDDSLPSVMVAPKNSSEVILPRGSVNSGTISYQTINDYGASSQLINKNVTR